MSRLSLLLCAMFGLLMTMSFSGQVTQPDWCLAMLLGAALSYRQSWPWVLPCVCLHDLVLYYSVWVVFPYFMMLIVFIIYTDQALGQGQQQRWFALCLGCFPLLLIGLSLGDIVLTMALAVMVWSFLSYQREKVYVEPA